MCLRTRYNEDSNCKIDVTPLVDCVDDIWDFSKIYNGRGKFKKMVKMSSDNDRIRELKERVYALVPIMNLGGVVKLAEQFSEMAQELASLKRTISAIYPAIRVSTQTLVFRKFCNQSVNFNEKAGQPKHCRHESKWPSFLES